jgi:hypothetical protein
MEAFISLCAIFQSVNTMTLPEFFALKLSVQLLVHTVQSW